MGTDGAMIHNILPTNVLISGVGLNLGVLWDGGINVSIVVISIPPQHQHILP